MREMFDEVVFLAFLDEGRRRRRKDFLGIYFSLVMQEIFFITSNIDNW